MGAMCSYQDQKLPKTAKNRRHYKGGYDDYDFRVKTDCLTKLSSDILVIFVEDGEDITSRTEHFNSLSEKTLSYLNDQISKDGTGYFHFNNDQDKGLNYNYIGVVKYDRDQKNQFERKLQNFFESLKKLKLRNMVICDLPTEFYGSARKRVRVLLNSIGGVDYDIPDYITIRASDWKSGNQIRQYLDDNKQWE